LSNELAIVFTVDYFPPIVDDPNQYGRISAANSLSDVYAMGGRPILALNIVNFPKDLPMDILEDIIAGGSDVARSAGVIVAGGHSIDDDEPKYGMAVVGVVNPNEYVTNSGAKTGDKLILTKPLGTGIITTAAKDGIAKKADLDKAIMLMNVLNRDASEAMVTVGVNACTDVTGFGLMGHLLGMLKSNALTAKVFMNQVPAMDGATDLINLGAIPGGTVRNLESVAGDVDWHQSIKESDKILACDAQTSGGLLLSVPPEKLTALTEELDNRSVRHYLIGEILPSGPKRIIVEA
jgi:selenide,water dikinase